MRYELSDNEGGVIRTMLPTKSRSVPRVDDRRVLNGIFGCCDLMLLGGISDLYGPRTTCCNRFVRWRRAGIWKSIMKAMTA